MSEERQDREIQRELALSNFQRFGPRLSDAVVWVLSASQQRKGVSLTALKKALVASGYDLGKKGNRLKQVLRRMVSKGQAEQITGVGFSGSFKIKKPVGKPQPRKAKKTNKASSRGKRVKQAKSSKKNREKATKKNKKDSFKKPSKATKSKIKGPKPKKGSTKAQ